MVPRSAAVPQATPFPPECDGFRASGVARLEQVHGDWRGRLESGVALGAPSPNSPHEAFLITGGLDGVGCSWLRVDVARGVELERHRLGVARAYPTAMREDGERVALSRGGPCSLRTRDGTFVWKRTGGWMVQHFVPGEPRLLATNPQGFLAELDAETGAEVARIAGAGPIALARDGRRFAFRDGRAKGVALWDRAQARVVTRWPGCDAAPLAVLPGRDVVVGLTVDRGALALCCLHADERSPRWSVALAPEARRFTGVSLSANGDAILLATLDGLIVEYDADDGAERRRHQVPLEARAFFRRDGRGALLVAGNVCHLWDAETGRVAGTTGGHSRSVHAVAFGETPARVASVADDVRVWEAAGARTIVTSGAPSLAHHAGRFFFTREGTLLLWSRHGPRLAWAPDGTPAEFPYDLSPATCAWAVSPDERLLWVEEEKDSFNRRTLLRRSDHRTLWEHPSGGPVAFAGDAVVTTAWKVGSGEPYACWLRERGDVYEPELVPLQARSDDLSLWGPPFTSCALSDDGTLLAARVRGDLWLFDTRSGQRVATAASLASWFWFAGARWLVTQAYGADAVEILDVPTLELRGKVSLASARDAPSAVAVTPDGRALLLGTRRGVVLRFSLEG